MKSIDPKEIAVLAAEAAEDQKAENVIILDVRKLTTIADYFLICSGNSPIQVRAIASFIEEELKKVNVRMDHQEGFEEGKWVLLDYGEVIMHIFYHETRLYYGLEHLWGDAKTVRIPGKKNGKRNRK